MTLDDADAVSLLTRLVATPSLTGQEDRVASLLLEWMEAAGFRTCRDGMGNAVGSTGPQEADGEVVILGHMDTVPGAIPVEVRDGSLYGRGAVDAKGPLAAGVVAAGRAAQRSRMRLTVIGAVQEEGPSLGARFLLTRPAPDYLIIAEPSGWDAVVLGYKGSQRFTAEIAAPAGHTAGPGETGPERAFAFWNDLLRWCASFGGEDHFSRLTPTLIRMQSLNTGLEDIAYLHIGLRLPPGVSVPEVQQGVRALLPDARFYFNAGEEAVRGGKSNPLVAGFLRGIRAEGGKPRFKVKTGTSDMNVVGPVWGCPMLAYGPGDSTLDHTAHEHVRLPDYLCAVRVLTRVLEEL